MKYAASFGATKAFAFCVIRPLNAVSLGAHFFFNFENSRRENGSKKL